MVNSLLPVSFVDIYYMKILINNHVLLILMLLYYNMCWCQALSLLLTFINVNESAVRAGAISSQG